MRSTASSPDASREANQAPTTSWKWKPRLARDPAREPCHSDEYHASRSSSASVSSWEYAPLSDEAVPRIAPGLLHTLDLFLFFDLPVLAMFFNAQRVPDISLYTYSPRLALLAGGSSEFPLQVHASHAPPSTRELKLSQQELGHPPATTLCPSTLAASK